VRITSVNVTPIWMAMEHPYVIATSAMAANPVDIVTVETDEGLTGLRVHRRDAVDGRGRHL